MKDSTYAKILQVQLNVEDELFEIEGVTGISIGYKSIDGVKTETPALIIYVAKKKPLSELSPSNYIPAVIEGVVIDVVEAGAPEAHTGQ